jgi:uncharacterized integral membrane protein
VYPIAKANQSIQFAYFVLCGIVIFLLLLLCAFFHSKRKTLVIRSSSYMLTLGVIFSLIGFAICGIFFTLSPHEYPSVCHLRQWFPSFSVVSFTSLVFSKAHKYFFCLFIFHVFR